MNKKHTTAILLAAGSGKRMGISVTKQMIEIFGESVLSRTVRAFCECQLVDSVVLAVRSDEAEYIENTITCKFPKIKKVVYGGKTRAESARLAFAAIPAEATHVAIHDAARCLITPEMISKVIEEAYKSGAATAGSFVTDTVKVLSDDGLIEKTFPREKLFFASTPQVFATEIYKKAIDSATDFDKITDDNMLVEGIGVKISAVDLGKENIKITTFVACLLYFNGYSKNVLYNNSFNPIL